MWRKFLGVISVDFDVTGTLLVLYSTFVKYLRKNLNKMGQFISYLMVSDELLIL